MEGRSGEVDEELRAGERELGRGRARLPHVFADRRSDECAAVFEQDEVAAGSEVPVLVEDSVVRQETLTVDRLDLPGSADGAGVVEIAVEPRDADQGDDSSRLTRESLSLGLRGADEAGPEQQVLRRIAGHRQLGKDDEVYLVVLGLCEPLENSLRVPVEVADDGVDLSQRESHR